MNEADVEVVNRENPGEPPRNSAPSEHPDQKLCISCGSLIPRTAHICSVCKSYQNAWKNFLVFFSGVTSVVILTGSAISFIWSNYFKIMEQSKYTCRIDLHYLRTQIHPEFDAVFSSSWPEPIFIDELTLKWSGGYVRYRVNRQIQSREFLSIERIVNPKTEKEKAEAYSEFIARSFVANESGTRGKALRQVDLNVVRAQNKNSDCFLPVFFNSQSTDLERIKDLYSKNNKKLISESAEGNFLYYVPTTWLRVVSKFSAVITFVRSKSKSCENIDVE